MTNFWKAIEKQSLYIAVSLIVIIQVYLLLFNGETYGGADNIQHFQIARYAFKYPELFLDLWGKPVYTGIIAPFAPLGYSVVKGINLLLAVCTLFLAGKLSRDLVQGTSLYTILLIAFSPVYFFLMITCLTEVLFSLVLVSAVYLFYKNKLAFSAIILSFIPFVRSEGLVLFPVFALAYFLRKAYGQILLLAVGTIFFSLIGFFAFGDLLWILHRFPYSMGDSVYGHGSLLHFVMNSNFIFGVPFLILLVLGLIYWLFQIFRKFSFKDENLILFIVITGSWLGYFVAHSYVWWKGTGGSLGLTRVIGAVIPLAALTAAKGIQLISESIKNRRISTGIISFLVAAQVFLLFSQNDLPTKTNQVDQLIAESCTYLKQESISGKVFYFNPELVFHLEIDPYDQAKCNWGIADKQQPSNSMNYGDILIWDAHFGPNEGGVLLDNLMNDPQLQLIKSVIPAERFQVLGGYDYEIHIFRKVEQKVVLEQKQQLVRELNFSDSGEEHLEVFSGEKMYKLDSNTEFSPVISIPVAEIQARDYLDISAFLNFVPKETIPVDAVLLILSVEVDHQSVSYNKLDLTNMDTELKKQNLTFPLKLKADFPEGAIINLYVWNKNKMNLLLGDLKLTIKGY